MVRPIVVAVLAILLALVRPAAASVVAIGADEFTKLKAGADKRIFVVKFFRSNCPNCRNFGKEYARFAQSVSSGRSGTMLDQLVRHGDGPLFGEFDCSQGRVCAAERVSAVPLVIVYRFDGKATKLPSPGDLDADYASDVVEAILAAHAAHAHHLYQWTSIPGPGGAEQADASKAPSLTKVNGARRLPALATGGTLVSVV